MEHVFFSFSTQVPLKKATAWGTYTCTLSYGSCCLKSASIPCLQVLHVPIVVSKSVKPTVSPVSEFMKVCNQSAIADAVSKEVKCLENISNICSAGKTELETKSVNASKDRDQRRQLKVQNKAAEAILWPAFHASVLPLCFDHAHSTARVSHATEQTIDCKSRRLKLKLSLKGEHVNSS